MKNPVIGITTSFESTGDGETRIFLNADYIAAVERSGGVPIVIPVLTSREVMREAVARVDALIIPGGPGITDNLVGSLPDDLPEVREERRTSDLYAFEAGQDQEKPLFGICYGMQFINARYGGSIYGDVQQEIGVGPHHPRRSDSETIEHGVTIESGSRLQGIIERADPVNSSHIQAVADVGEGLRVSVRSEDGLVEGLESEDGRIVGVQFHPERLAGSAWDRLFTDLVDRASQ